MSNIYSQFPKEPKSPDNEVASDYFFDSPITNALIEELKKPCDWDRKDMVSLCREFERELAEKTNEVARLREENEQLTDLFEYYYNCFDEADVERMDLEEEVARLRDAYLASVERDDFLTQENARLRELLNRATDGINTFHNTKEEAFAHAEKAMPLWESVVIKRNTDDGLLFLGDWQVSTSGKLSPAPEETITLNNAQ
jgi:predicted RNase H-like nuclease (RuvC/YqgF family)